MTRLPGFHAAALLCVLALQGVMLWRMQVQPVAMSVQGPDAGADVRVPRHATHGDPFDAGGDRAAAMALLARIDARLAALERAAMPQAQGAAPPSDAPYAVRRVIDPDSPAAHAADAALVAMLPGPAITDAQMAQLRARILQAPPAQQFSLEAALARAINSGRLRVGP